MLANALDEDTEALADDDNLLDYGLDSVRIMSLASHWHKEGHDLDFIAASKADHAKILADAAERPSGGVMMSFKNKVV